MDSQFSVDALHIEIEAVESDDADGLYDSCGIGEDRKGHEGDSYDGYGAEAYQLDEFARVDEQCRHRYESR